MDNSVYSQAQGGIAMSLSISNHCTVPCGQIQAATAAAAIGGVEEEAGAVAHQAGAVLSRALHLPVRQQESNQPQHSMRRKAAAAHHVAQDGRHSMQNLRTTRVSRDRSMPGSSSSTVHSTDNGRNMMISSKQPRQHLATAKH